MFYLGTHEPSHLRRTSVPLFVSRRRLARLQRLPEAAGRWALDSGGFTELSMFGEWTITSERYVREVRRYAGDIGHMDWASPMDWMCEPWITAKTGLSVAEHQRRTVANYLALRDRAPDLPWVPVLQGWLPDDYRRCADMYAAAGVDLVAAQRVGVGSVCRRQHTAEAGAIIGTLALLGMRVHAYGLKLGGLKHSADMLASSDSMAWSAAARRRPPLPGCAHRSCANCLRYALQWCAQVESVIAQTERTLFSAAA